MTKTTTWCAALSPRDQTVAMLDHGGTTARILAGRLTGVSVPAGTYLSRSDNYALVQVDGDTSAMLALQEHVDATSALDYMLYLFDSDLSVDLRREIATSLTEKLRSHTIQEWVLNILLSAPLPPAADIDGALEATATTEIEGLLKMVANSQSFIAESVTAWKASSSTEIFSETEEDDLFATMVRLGAFRAITFDAVDVDGWQDVKTKIVFSPSIRSKSAKAKRLVNAWLESLRTSCCERSISASQLTTSTTLNGSSSKTINSASKPIEGHPEGTLNGNRSMQDSESASGRSRHSFPTRGNESPNTLLRAALSTIEKIVECYNEGKDNQGNTYLEELIQETLRNSNNDPTHVVKSLSNIAAKCRDLDRQDVSASCLRRAINYPNGIDAVAYFQIGTLFREIGSLDEAQTCYEKAEALALARHEPEDSIARIRSAKIYLLTVRGQLEEALKAYKEINDYQIMPSVIVSIGDIYRRMGRRRQALLAYNNCLAMAPDAYRAIAGKAELCKQNGNYHGAIRWYNWLFSNHPNLYSEEPHSYAVYEMSRSRLFTFVQQPQFAEESLKRVIKRIPFNRQAVIQLSNLYAAQGDLQKAHDCRDRLKHRAKDEIRWTLMDALSQLRLGQMPKASSLGSVVFQSSSHVNSDWLKCASAFLRVVHGDSTSIAELQNTRFVDRTLQDFSQVMQLHVSTTHVGNAAQQQRLNVLAKKGIAPFRRCIEFIRGGKPSDAFSAEAEILLRTAS